jgi:hypothetical protein
MIKNIFNQVKIFSFVAITSVLLMGVFGYVANSALAFDANNAYGMNKVKNVNLSNKADPVQMVTNIINLCLGFLALISVIIILIGGFQWMTAGGNDDKVGKAKKLMTNGLIGLVIVLCAWGIATFAINTIFNVTDQA